MSLRLKLFLWFSLSSFTLIVCSSGYLFYSLVRMLEIEEEHLLEDKVGSVREHLAFDIPDFSKIKAKVEHEWIKNKHEKVFVRILDSHFSVITETPAQSKILKDYFQLNQNLQGPFHARLIRTQLNDDTQISFKNEVIKTSKNKVYLVQFAVDRTSESELLSQYKTRLFVVLLISLAGTLFITLEMVKKGLKPLTEMSDAVSKMSSDDLSHRLTTQALPTELNLLAQAFNQLLNRLEASFERLNRFSADIAHELRTPVHSMSVQLGVTLSQEREKKEYLETIQSVLEECDRLTQTIQSLLFFAQAENPHQVLKKEKIQLGRELEALIEFYEILAEEKNISIKLDQPDTAIALWVEKTLFQKAIGNLILNAIQYNHVGGNVLVKTSLQNDYVEIQIQDTGPGMAPEHLEKIFERFYRVDASRESKIGGTGLGLAIVKTIVKLHGGLITVHSRLVAGAVTATVSETEQSGTTFQVSLPMSEPT